jgi:hypothetical protein
MALHLRWLLVAVVVASALGSGDTEASTTAGALVVLGYRGPENGSEPLGLAAVGGDPPGPPPLLGLWCTASHLGWTTARRWRGLDLGLGPLLRIPHYLLLETLILVLHRCKLPGPWVENLLTAIHSQFLPQSPNRRVASGHQ